MSKIPHRGYDGHQRGGDWDDPLLPTRYTALNPRPDHGPAFSTGGGLQEWAAQPKKPRRKPR